MKIYHKFLLYQNKWIHPYVRMTVGVMTSITYLASILLIVGVVYEHGFTISEVEAHQLQRLYHGVWIVFSGRCHPSHLAGIQGYPAHLQ